MIMIINIVKEKTYKIPTTIEIKLNKLAFAMVIATSTRINHSTEDTTMKLLGNVEEEAIGDDKNKSQDTYSKIPYTSQ